MRQSLFTSGNDEKTMLSYPSESEIGLKACSGPPLQKAGGVQSAHLRLQCEVACVVLSS